jgi:hypothetical protein
MARAKRMMAGFKPAVVAVCLCLLSGAPAQENDSTAELGTGGLILARSDIISMDSEVLRISAKEIRVDYEFRNGSDKDIETIVAFPMPDIVGIGDGDISVPDDSSVNFLGFTVTIDGKPVTPQLEQRAIAQGLDVTADLMAAGVPMLPVGRDIVSRLDALPAETAKNFEARGIVRVEQWDEGQGMKDHRLPAWTLKSTYWWRTVFAARQTVAISHRYQPSIGSTAGSVIGLETTAGELEQLGYVDRYCMDRNFIEAAMKKARGHGGGMREARIEYVLRTGANWAGPIKNFRLVVDKGAPDALVSFCGDDVRKTGATTFEMVKSDFIPERDLNIVIFSKPGE